MLTQAPVPASSGILKTSTLETDVSGTGWLKSRKMASWDLIVLLAELEMLALMWAVKHFCVYLYGHT